LEDRGVGETLGIEGFDISRWNIAKRRYQIETPNERSEWRELFSIIGTVKTPPFGRKSDSRLKELRGVAQKHIRFENTSRGLYMMPYDTLNGVYRMIRQPVELWPGARFRIGNYIMTYRESEMPEPGKPREFDGEWLLARDLKPLGLIEFLRPDGQPGVRFPIVNPEGMVLGRGGRDHEGRETRVDLPLIGDRKVSHRHAQISWRGGEGDTPVLDDLGSKSGTWIQVVDRALVAHEDILWLGELYLRVIEIR
jgi:pSer/pThr/pTyr-binding forkhead associated (FHA) protein